MQNAIFWGEETAIQLFLAAESEVNCCLCYTLNIMSCIACMAGRQTDDIIGVSNSLQFREKDTFAVKTFFAFFIYLILK